MAAELDITIDRLDDESFKFVVTDLAKKPVPIGNSTIQMQFFATRAYLDSEMLQEVEALVPDDADAANGTCYISILSEQTNFSLKKIYYKSRLIGAGGSPISTLTLGKCIIKG